MYKKQGGMKDDCVNFVQARQIRDKLPEVGAEMIPDDRITQISPILRCFAGIQCYFLRKFFRIP